MQITCCQILLFNKHDFDFWNADKQIYNEKV